MNLDAMTETALRRVFADESINPTLRQYAHLKAGAIRCRLIGKIARAVYLEGECETLYHRLPDDLRW